MSRFQNLEVGFFTGEDVEGIYDFPKIEPVYEIPQVKRHIEFDYCNRVRNKHADLGVHFFEDDYKFERCWVSPDRYGEMLSKFAYLIGPDYSVYADFPMSMRIYNHYRNRWLVRYWQICYNMIIVPTVMWGYEDSWSWCFDGYPKNSIVAVSNVGCTKAQADKKYFKDGYLEMLKRLEPTKILFFTRNFEEMPGNVEYIRWEIHKGDQLDG